MAHSEDTNPEHRTTAERNTTTTTTTTSGGNSVGIIVAALVLIVAVLAYFVFGGGFDGAGNGANDVNITVEGTEPAAPAADSETPAPATENSGGDAAAPAATE